MSNLPQTSPAVEMEVEMVANATGRIHLTLPAGILMDSFLDDPEAFLPFESGQRVMLIALPKVS